MILCGEVTLTLTQRCVVPLYVRHNIKCTLRLPQRYIVRHVNYRFSRNKTGKRKVFLGNLQSEYILFYFHNLNQILFEFEKKSSLVTHALSAKSCTRDTDSLHSCTRLANASCKNIGIKFGYECFLGKILHE